MSRDYDQSHTSLEPLLVIDRLEIGPTRLERRRLLCPYRIIRGGAESIQELIFRYQEEVFDPKEDTSRNLAAMIGAQVALNYALFCREMVFRGPYEAADRRFLLAMARNTAREVYVNKLLGANRFLRSDFNPPVVHLQRYDQAKMNFPEAPGPDPAEARSWPLNPSCYAVLSSGGKESLLSFGLLHELGLPVHPLFINESGRHWYTALNAFRYFRAFYPDTARVWTNSDRIFSWFLRHLPFIRPDFSRLRSDYHPVRLWTVAVMAFAALPLLKKRGIGRLVIGDEFDTTRRAHDRGIPHYEGLFDQSIYFDRALTRYFREKGWGVGQLSILRPLSELLIQKILLERYPELQRHQMSCHAAHLVEAWVRPCGRCEKCRRIIAMLSALGEDATRSGFKKEQVARALRSLGEDHLHQEEAVVQHIFHMLGLRSGGMPEVLKLRFDPKRSPIEGLPPEVRSRLLRIWLEHAQGALTRKAGSWVDFDP